MARAKKNEEEKTAADVLVDQTGVEVHIDRDPNDPRLTPVVDGNDLPKVDINKPGK